MRTTALRFEFVHLVPREPQPGTLYISVECATANHRCCCGCGLEVVTPIAPRGWSLTFDGETVSLDPSIGNWSFPCQSHYWIRRNRIEWAPRWSRHKIDAERAAEQLERHQALQPVEGERPTVTDPPEADSVLGSWWARAGKWLRSW